MAYGEQGAPGNDSQVYGTTQPLLDRGSSSLFELKQRPQRDVPWLVAYLVFMGAAVAGGIYSFCKRNTQYLELTSGDPDPKLCPISATTHASRRLLQQGPDAPPAFNLDLFMRAAAAWVAASAGGAVLMGLLFVWLVRTTPSGLVRMALVLQVLAPTVAGIVLLAVPNGTNGWIPSVVFFGFAALLLLLFWLWRSQINLVTQLLGLAGRGLSANPGLVPLSLALQVGLVFFVELPLLLASMAAYMNGTLAYNLEERVDGGAAASAQECVDGDGDSVECCVWKVESWVPFYIAVAAIAMSWSVFLALQVKIYTVAGAIAQWYFAPRRDAASSLAGAASSSGSRSRTLTAFRFAVGPSLGSLCAGAAVMTAVSYMRQALEKARRQRDNLVSAIIVACLSLVMTLIEFVTRFATVRAAITGEAFFTAGRNVVGLLKRNAMDAFGVWWLPGMILQSCCFILALCWAGAVAALSYATTWSHQAAAGYRDQAAVSAGLTALVALLAAWVVLGFLASIIISVVDALFVCFAMDRDRGEVSQLDVHDVMSKLPTVGAVVQQPDGGLAYGAPPGSQEQPQRGSAARV